jgi:hypothetical protein
MASKAHMSKHSPTPRLQALRQAPLDSWVALSEDETRVVASGSGFQDVVAKAKANGVSDPVIVKTPKRWLPIAG